MRRARSDFDGRCPRQRRTTRTQPTRRAQLADHTYGELTHEHEGDADHDHDHFEFDDDGPIEQNPIWLQDHVTLVSVGIDIGSSGTQVIFSRINLRRYGEDLTSRYYVVSRETLYQSPVALTPYPSEERIDDAALGKIIDDAYAGAGLHPDEIDTGAVILTGEALRRENAEGIAKILSEQGGEFVCATAGHHMESMLAAYGSGASRVSHDEDKRVLNIDIGGGTTKLALVEKGQVMATAAVHIGGRLQVVDEDRQDRPPRPGRQFHARQAGFDWHKGDTIEPQRPRQGRRRHGRRPGRGADGAADVARRSSISTSPTRSPISATSTASCSPAGSANMSMAARPATSATWGAGSATRSAAARRCRRAAMAAAAGRRMHPRHRARRLRIQRPAQRQYQLHQQARRAPAAPQPAGAAAAVSNAGT